MRIRYISFIFVAIFVICSFIFDFPTEYLNLALALTVLIGQIAEYMIFRENLKGNILFKLSSNEWINGWIMVGLIMYWFSNEDMNVWNITAITALIIYGILGSIQLNKTVYASTEKGILNLSSNTLISFENIQDIEFDSDRISIHTPNSRNEIVIQKSKLVEPNWDELTSNLTDIKKRKANIS